MKSKILSILFASGILLSASTVSGFFAGEHAGDSDTPPELTKEYICFLESATNAKAGKDSAFSRSNCRSDRAKDMSVPDKNAEPLAPPSPSPSSKPTPVPTPAPTQIDANAPAPEQPKSSVPVTVRVTRPTVTAAFPRSYRKVGGRLVCAKKNDHPSKSDKNKRGHMDMECCLDPDEVPNPHCYYPPEKYGKYLK